MPPSQCVAESAVEASWSGSRTFNSSRLGRTYVYQASGGAMAVMQKKWPLACAVQNGQQELGANPAAPTAALTPEESQKRTRGNSREKSRKGTR